MEENDLPYVALTKDINDTIIMITKKNIYKVSTQYCTSTIIKNANISGIHMIDSNHCYAIV